MPIYILAVCPLPVCHSGQSIALRVQLEEVTEAAIMSATPLNVVLAALVIWLSYLFVYAVHTLYFHPLAKFPGPKLAALTDYYEFYYNAIKCGMYMKKIEEMHERYGDDSLLSPFPPSCSFLLFPSEMDILTCETGPIVRVTSEELHIKDSDFFDKIYLGARKTDKQYKNVMLLSAPASLFGTIDHDHHRQRLSAVHSFFSKRSIAELEPMISDKVEQLCQRLAALSGTKQVLNLKVVYMALSADVISEFCFGECLDYLQREDFAFEWAEIMKYSFRLAAFFKPTPWVHPIFKVTPVFLMDLISPKVAALLRWQKMARKKASYSIEKHRLGEKGKRRTVFQGLLESDLPPEEKSLDRISDEAQIMLSGGSETLSSALSSTTFFILRDKARLKKLRDELASVPFKQLGNKGLLAHLQKLPYLVRCAHYS
jgi:Cytochrome P450